MNQIVSVLASVIGGFAVSSLIYLGLIYLGLNFVIAKTNTK